MVQWIKIAIIGVSAIVGVGSIFVLKKQDNHVEETCEKIIKDQTGVDVDLSPLTPEDIALDKKSEEDKASGK